MRRLNWRRGAGADESQLLELLSIGCLRPRLNRKASLDALRVMAPDDAAQAFGRHKIRQVAFAALRREPELSPYASALGPRVERTREVLADRPRSEALLAAHAHEAGVEILRIKGLAMLDRYPAEVHRDINDLDVYVQSIDAAWRLAQELLDGDYEYRREELPWLKRRADSTFYGQIQVMRPLHTAQSLIDIHFGCYSVRHASHMDVPCRGKPGVATLDVTSNVPLLVANMAGDHFVTVKDVNDFLLLIGDEEVDWDEARRTIDGAGLGGFFNVVLHKLGELCELDAEELRKIKDLRMRARPEPVPPWSQAIWGQRWRATTVHAGRMGLRSSPVAAVRLGAGAARYYRRPLRLRCRRLAPRPRLEAARLSSDRCWRLVPAGMAAELTQTDGSTNSRAATPEPFAGPFRRIRTPAGDLIERTGEIYVPTVMYSVSPGLVGWATGLGAAESAPQPELAFES